MPTTAAWSARPTLMNAARSGRPSPSPVGKLDRPYSKRSSPLSGSSMPDHRSRMTSSSLVYLDTPVLHRPCSTVPTVAAVPSMVTPSEEPTVVCPALSVARTDR